MPYFYFDSYYFLLVIPAMFIALWAQFKVNHTFSKYNEYYSSSGQTASSIARRILDENGLFDIRIERVSGRLSDHYDPKSRVIRLSDSVYDSTSVGAIGVAAHEVGHAIQYKEGYLPIKLRSALIPITTIGSNLSIPLAILGIIMGVPLLTDIGIILFLAVVAFQLVTLPVEFNASNRAVKTLREGYMLNEDELYGTKKVLTAAALTYVAALIVAIANLLRLVLLRNNRRHR